MSYAVTQDFKGGLDRRRSRIAGPPGTLWTCDNAHITRGGEIEKRKKFVSKFALPAGTFGLESAAGNIYVFGSAADPGVPPGVIYQRLVEPNGSAMTKILDTEVFDGKVYAIAQFANGYIHHYYDGALVTDWESGIVTAEMVNNDGIAEHLRGLIAANAAYTATRVGSVITITAAVVGTPFTISATAENVDGGVNDQKITLVQTVANIASVPEVLSSASFAITGGTASAGVNKVSSIKVNGIEILNTSVDWTTSNSGTATLIATQINAFNSVPEYTAVATGQTVTISAVAGTGIGPNGFTVAITAAGNVTVDHASTTMAGGVAAATGQAQVYTAAIGGTFEVGDKFTITIDKNVFGNSGNPASKGKFSLTHKTKLYSLAGSVAYFCGVNTPTKWNLANTGAGFQNMASQDSGSDVLVSIGKFQGNLTFFARRAAQVWFIDADASKSQVLQIIENTGTMAPLSVLSFGDYDMFYLCDSGIRSIRQMFGTSNVYVNDVGTAIDPLITGQMLTLSADTLAASCAVIEPVNGRYIINVDNTNYVFSFFMTSKVSAWSTYTMAPGAGFTNFTVILNKLYARSGDTIYLYGGDDLLTYDSGAGDNYVVTVATPFISAGKIATEKYVTGFDFAVQGTWTVNLLHDPNDETKKTALGTFTGQSYSSEGWGASGESTMFALEFICNTPGAASISNFALHYEEGEE